jgi:hypothetical protein
MWGAALSFGAASGILAGHDLGGGSGEDLGAAGGESGITPLYRVSPAERGTSELENGLDPANFPRTDELDGAARFGNETRVQDFAASHADTHGVGFRVDVPSNWLRINEIETQTGMTASQLEYIIPRELFDQFNQFPRFPWSP